jgi:RNA polymerase sigma-70 factor, ECF subfamily
MDTPASLLERLRDPADAAARDRFVELYTPLLFLWARRAGLQDADGADLVQEVLVSLLQKLPAFTYDRDRSFRRWLRTVLLNKWRELRRRRCPSPLGDAADDLPAPDELAALEQEEYRRHLVHQALRALQAEFPATSWSAFWEHVMCGRPAADVADALGVRVGTVYAAKSRVLSRLRRELDGLLDG